MSKKTMTKVLTLCLAALLALSLAACSSGGGEKTLTGYYQSTQNVAFVSAYPEFTYKQATFGVETIELYADGTYCLTDTESNFSGGLSYNDDGTHSEIPRGSDSKRFYGTYTSKEESGLLTITLASPTSVVVASSYSAAVDAVGYLNTDAWTDDMGARVATEEGGSLTAAQYLASVAFPQTTVIVDTATGSFDYFIAAPQG